MRIPRYWARQITQLNPQTNELSYLDVHILTVKM